MMADNMYRVERESDLHGFLAAGNLRIDCLGEIRDMGVCAQYNHLLYKFSGD